VQLGDLELQFGQLGSQPSHREASLEASSPSETPVQRHDGDYHHEPPDRDRKTEFPVVAELVSAGPVHHQVHRRRDRGEQRAMCSHDGGDDGDVAAGSLRKSRPGLGARAFTSPLQN
jgi:hypothetical protein